MSSKEDNRTKDHEIYSIAASLNVYKSIKNDEAEIKSGKITNKNTFEVSFAV